MREKDKWGFRGEAGQSGGAVSISCKSDHLAEGLGRHRARHSAGRARAGLRSAGPASVFPLPPSLRTGSRLSCQCGQPLVWSLLAKAARPRACSHTYTHARTHTHTRTHARAQGAGNKNNNKTITPTALGSRSRGICQTSRLAPNPPPAQKGKWPVQLPSSAGPQRRCHCPRRLSVSAPTRLTSRRPAAKQRQPSRSGRGSNRFDGHEVARPITGRLFFPSSFSLGLPDWLGGKAFSD